MRNNSKFDSKKEALAAQYRVLSEICDLFPNNSSHKAYRVIKKKMDEILSDIFEMKKSEMPDSDKK